MPGVLPLPKAVQELMQHFQLGRLGVSTETLAAMDMRAKCRLGLTSWAQDGLGSPTSVHFYYVVKALAYLLGFRAFAGRGALASVELRRDAFRRFVVYNLLFEVLGLGCGSGPLTGRLWPPHTAWFHWLCPGTVKLPLRLNPRDSRRPLLPWLSPRRSRLDVALFVSYLATLLRALLAPRVTDGACRLICAPLFALAVVDHTAFLASRGEVYGSFLAAQAAGATAGSQLVQLAVYSWAAVSKLGPWFAHVIQAMLSNSPCCPLQVRSKLYRDVHAGDFHPSSLARGLAYLGTAMEASIPALLPFGGRAASLGLLLSAAMHTFIFTNFALGCPQEWNIFTPIAVYHLFIDTSDGLDWRALRAMPSQQPLLAAFLAFVLGLVPTVGSFYPPASSFLMSMKYYAGNWPGTVWLVRRSAWHKFDKLLTLTEFLVRQVEVLYGKQHVEDLQWKLYGFRALHLPYYGLPKFMGAALRGRPLEEYYYMEGEFMASTILGYNFGDGYLHGRYMLQAVQDICGFEAGELLHISMDSCPAHSRWLPWAVRDATALWDDEAAVAMGRCSIYELQESQPY